MQRGKYMEMILYAFVFAFGTILGSFYNVVIYRLPRKLSIVKGTSMCPTCQHRVHPQDLVPILSFIFLRGKCAHCHAPISWRYPMIELLTGALFLIAFQRFGFTTATLVAFALASLCVIIAMIDIDTMEILDRFHIFIAILAFIQIFAISSLSLSSHLLGFIIISVPLYIIAVITNGIGGGDIKLMAVSGLLLGFEATLVAFFIAALLGGSVAIVLLLTKQTHMKSLIAFGPYLCIGIFFAYCYGIEVFNWYIRLFGV